MHAFSLRMTTFAATAALLLAGAGCARTATAPPSTPGPSAAGGSDIEAQGLVESAVVSIGPNGFSPAAITVKKGESVTWINEDPGASHWVASAPHPAHTDYPGFDAGAPIAPGSSWGFVFSRPGTWKYHDHLNPQLRGTVEVKE